MAYRDRGEHDEALKQKRRKRKKGDDLLIKPLSKADLHNTRTPKGLENQRRLREAAKASRARQRVMEIEMERQKTRKDWRIPKELRRLYGTSKDA